MFRVEVWFVSTLFCCGIIAGLLLSPRAPAPLVTPTTEERSTGIPPSDLVNDPSHLPPNPAEAEEMGLSTQLATELMQRVDRELLLAKNREAVELLKRNLPGSADEVDPEFNIRWALADELRGEFRQAENRYRILLQQQPEPAVEMLALSGLCRVWLAQDKVEAAQSLLSDLFLQSAKLESEVGDLWGEVSLVMAQSFRQELLAPTPPNGLPWTVMSVRAMPDIDAIVEILKRDYQQGQVANAGDPVVSEAPPKTDDKVGITVIQNVSPDPDLIFLDAQLPTQGLLPLMAQLSSAVGIEIDLTPAARDILTARTKVISFRGRNLAMVLDALLLPLGLIWEKLDDRIRVTSAEQVDSEKRWVTWQSAASRLFQLFTFEFSTDSRLPVAQLEMANLAFELNDVDRAAADYQTLIQGGVKGEVLATACFNLAWLNYSRLRRLEAAIAWATRAMDQSFELPKQMLAESLIAYIHLELGRIDSATKDAGRVIGLDTSSPAAEQAALTLARAYLLKNLPVASNQAIFDARDSIQHPGNRKLAGFLSSYARFLANTSDAARKRELEALLIELSQVMQLPELSPIDQYLIARAYQELGFENLMLEYFQKALAGEPTQYWFDRMQYELALVQSNEDGRSTQMSILQNLSGNPDESLSILAKVQMARVHLDQRQWEDVLRICHDLPISEMSESNKRTVLKMMGVSYRQIGQPHAAALCFAGMLPSKSPNIR